MRRTSKRFIRGTALLQPAEAAIMRAAVITRLARYRSGARALQRHDVIHTDAALRICLRAFAFYGEVTTNARRYVASYFCAHAGVICAAAARRRAVFTHDTAPTAPYALPFAYARRAPPGCLGAIAAMLFALTLSADAQTCCVCRARNAQLLGTEAKSSAFTTGDRVLRVRHAVVSVVVYKAMPCRHARASLLRHARCYRHVSATRAYATRVMRRGTAMRVREHERRRVINHMRAMRKRAP